MTTATTIPAGAIGRAVTALDNDGTARCFMLGPVALFVRAVGDMLIISPADEDAPDIACGVTANTGNESGKPWALLRYDPEQGVVEVNTFTYRQAAIGAALALVVAALNG